jgi:protein-L-isoaspartate O-methyltransferase
VLDLGAGSGFSSEMLARFGYDVVAIDPRPQRSGGTGGLKRLRRQAQRFSLLTVAQVGRGSQD